MNPWHLPGLEGSHAPRRLLGEGPHQVPALDAVAVERIWNTLDAAAREWRAAPLVGRIEGLATVLREIGAAGPGKWLDALAATTRLSTAGVRAAWDVTFAPYDAVALHRVLEVEAVEAVVQNDATILPRRLVHVVAGNVIAATLSMLVRGWLLGAAQWLRPGAREPLFAVALADQLESRAPQLARTFAVSWWPHGDSVTEPGVLAGADVVTVQGDDAAVAALEARVARLAPHARVIGFGARWSMGLVARAAQTADTAAALAADIALFDQQGCLSPAIIFAEEHAGLEAWCAQVAAALEERERSMPRGMLDPVTRSALRSWREAMRLGVALGQVQRLWESAGTSAWAVALMSGCRFEPGPLDRHVPVVPFATEAELHQALAESRPRLQGIALDLSGWEADRAAELLRWLAPTRSAPPGALQLAPPDWRQDHHAPLRSLLRAG